MVKRELDAFFAKINQATYDKRGLEWLVIEGHYYIELRIYKERELKLEKFTSNPPTTQTNFNTDERLLFGNIGNLKY